MRNLSLLTDLYELTMMQGFVNSGIHNRKAVFASTLAWKIPWTEEPGGLCHPWVRTELDTTEAT